MAMWLWRLVHSARVNFSFILMGVLVFEGVLAVPLMFTFPPAALLLVFLGLATIGVSLLLRAMLTVADDSLARLLGIKVVTADPDAPSET